MKKMFLTDHSLKLNKTLRTVLVGALLVGAMQAEGLADVNINSGIMNDSIQGDHNQQANDAGVAVNGDVTDTNLSNNQNSNSNTNVVQPVAVAQPQYNSGSGRGGSAALVLPRNPLPLPNAALGRSNFGLQFGVQNNPGLSALTGAESALGWFLQGGLTIPFGKIPNVINNRQMAKMDDVRQDRIDAQRRVFGSVNPLDPNSEVNARVKGRVVGLNAYNYSTTPSEKIQPPPASHPVGEIVLPQPKVLALKPTTAYSQPLNTGNQVGLIEVGKEYPYLGHTRSGWVKVLLPNGKEAWASTNFEYVKFDYTEIDTLAVAPQPGEKTKAASSEATEKNSITRKRRS